MRLRHPAFGRGQLRLLTLDNAAILAYVRELAEETLVVVNNLAPDPQALSLDGLDYGDCTLIDLVSGQVVSDPRRLSLAGYGYHWFKLA